MHKCSNSSKHFRRFVQDNFSFLGLLVMLLIGSLVNPRYFLTVVNFTNVLRQSVMVGLLCCGITFVIISGQINLSISAVYAFSAFVSLWCLDRSPVLGVVGPIVMGILIGFVCGAVIVFMRVPAWVATLAVQLGVRGILLTLAHNVVYKPINEIPEFYTNLMQGTILNIIPLPIIVVVAAFLIANYVLNKTRIGRSIYAVGGNEEAAKMMGINVNKTYIIAHTICCGLAACAGIFLAARVGSAYPDSGTGYEMYAIASAALGGVLLSGGKGKMSGAFVGVMIMSLITNVFNMQNVIDPNIEKVVTGSILIIVLVSQKLGDVAAKEG